ncbi:MAG: TonB-dependent receptor [Sphingobium sp.]
MRGQRQNPGVISSLQEGSENFNASSTMNLRGIGADATLTLLNGHRVAYDAVAQGVDISAIPLIAIERVDVVADGSSALYGSDAVGGVANVILRRDYSGVETTARIGGATDGGSWQQQYSALAGKRWSSGGFMLAGDYNKSTAITAGQRSVTAQLFPTSIIYPPLEQISIAGAGHQDIAEAFAVELDAQYSHRETTSRYAFTRTADYTTSGNYGDRSVETYSVAPKLLWKSEAGWNAFITGVIGSSNSKALTRSYSGGRQTVQNNVSYVNDLRSFEVGGDGRLFSLPGGAAKIAIGAGFRYNSLSANIRSTRGSVTTVPTDYVSKQNIYFAYGELSLPIVGRANARPLLELLRFTGAVRYEHYDLFGGTATPKLGVVYEPVAGVQFSGTWGKSFKAPTLAQASRRPTGDLLPADFFIPEAPGGRPVLFLGGAMPGLGPERATSWNTSVTLGPELLSGLRVQVSYFETRYQDRVVEPLGDGDLVFGSAIYRDLITLSPSAAQISALIASLPLGLTNQTGVPLDPANVGAIADNRLQNIARQTLKGADIAISYAANLSSIDEIELSANASYLESTRQLSAGQPVIVKAGTIFDPPHWRGNGSLTWRHRRFGLTAVLNYIGGTVDDRFSPAVRVGSLKSLDLIARLSTGESAGLLSGFDATLALSNVFNEKPFPIRNTSAAAPTYDATNYPVVGRVISFTITKRW